MQVAQGDSRWAMKTRILRELAEAVAAARLPAATDQRLQELMDRNNEGKLSPNERGELESLAAWSEMLSLLRQSVAFFGTEAMTASWKEIADIVRVRAGSRCEYCQMHQALQGATFHVEHIIPTSLDGPTEANNLALACPSCNLHKSDLTQSTDPVTGKIAPMFNPRKDSWSDHFGWNEFQIEGKTGIGRATIEALHLNTERRLLIRQAEAAFGMFPP